MSCIGGLRLKPENKSIKLLGATRSKAKMNEYDVEEQYHIKLSQDPSSLFTLAIGLLGDLSAQLNAGNTNEKYMNELRHHLNFSAQFFDAYLEASISTDMDKYVLLLGSASYYL